MYVLEWFTLTYSNIVTDQFGFSFVICRIAVALEIGKFVAYFTVFSMLHLAA